MDLSMLKKFSLAIVLVGLSPVYGAGTVPGISMSQQFDQFGNVLGGCRLSIIRAGTTSTPQNAYQDTALTLPWPNPIICDSSGRIPQFFVADGLIKVRLTDTNGVNQLLPGGSSGGLDNILVIGPSGGGGGGSSVDATTILATGDVKARYGTGVLAGFVRLNGRTIGSATSGATERANLDCEALFEYLWNIDTTFLNLTVSTGRGATAVADWAANKTITLPDARGRALAGMDDMGNTGAGRLTSTYFVGSGTSLGSAGGSQSSTLTLAGLPTGIISSGPATVLSTNTDIVRYGGTFDTANVAAGTQSIFHSGGAVNAQIGSSGTATTTSTNTSGQPHAVVSPMITITYYQKL